MTSVRAAVAALIGLIVAFVVIVLVAVHTAARGRADSHPVKVSVLTTALRHDHVSICSQSRPQPVAHSAGAVSLQYVDVALSADCSDAMQLQLRAYTDAAHRDAAARNAEGLIRPRTVATVFTWHQFTIYLQADDASADAGLRDRVVAALDAVGAR